MKKIMFLILFFGFFLIQVNCVYFPNPIECSGQNLPYSMNVGDMALVQSPSFPKSMNDSTKNVLDCSFTFSRKDNQLGGIYFIFINGFTQRYTLSNTKVFYLSSGFLDTSTYYSNFVLAYAKNENVSALSYRYGDNSSNSAYSAFQAFVYIPEINEPKSDCFMSGKSFYLDNTWQIIPIFGISNLYQQTEGCFWNFTLSNGLSLKVVVNNAESNETATITDNSGTNHVLSKGLFYLNGSTFSISYTKLPRKSGGLGVFVSAVNLTIPPTNEQFKITQKYSDIYKKSVTVISAFDFIKGYPINTIYSTQVNYKPNTVMSFDSYFPLYEYLGDQVYLLSGNDKHLMDNSDLTRSVQVKEGNSVSVQFISDHNTVGAGVELNQIEHDCKCPSENITIPCENDLLFTLTDPSYTYCSGMNCKFSFVADQQCQDKKISIATTVLFRKSAGDSFTINANDTIYKNYTSTVSQEILIFDPKTKLEGIFISGTSLEMFYSQPEFQLVLSIVKDSGINGNEKIMFSIVVLILTALLLS